MPDIRGLDALDARTRAEAVEAIALAERLFRAAREGRTRKERAADAERAGMVRDLPGKDTVTTLLDRAFRSPSAIVTGRQVAAVLRHRGIPAFFAPWERAGLAIAGVVAPLLPWIVVPAITAVMRKKTAEVILPGAPRARARYMRERRKDGVRLNLNHLGEMILGEAEADEKLHEDVALLADPDVDCISVKASNLYSQISAMAHAQSVEMLCARLRPRLRAAKAHRRAGFVPSAAAPWDKGYKLVNLDMEEYRDLAITVDAFIATLDEDAFLDLQVGIAIQAYIPDSYGVVERLLAWASTRCARGGAPIRIRVVKGANRAMERVESSARGWAVPTYDDKADTDANWKAIVELITRYEHIAVCHLGVASHNAFDIAWASLLITRRGCADRCAFEMLEGMANHVQRAVQRDVGDVLLYAPTVAPKKFLTAIAYLVRRFDELTDPANFLSHAFDAEPGSEGWNAQAAAFVESLMRMPSVSHARRRTQDRRTESRESLPVASYHGFRNEPDTDWTGEGNRTWLDVIIAKREAFMVQPELLALPAWTAGVGRAAALAAVRDRTMPSEVVARVELASWAQTEAMLARAAGGAAAWTDLAPERRDAILAEAADRFRARRGDFMAYAAADVGKTFDQSDAEVSEAVDFGRLYPLSVREFRAAMPNVRFGPLGGGVVMVVSPWNFPIAIPAGGVFAALAAGNRVILKPSGDSRMVTGKIAECFWGAGVPRDTLQVLQAETAIAARAAADPRVDAVIFTGGTGTADRILAARKGRGLFAETGGKDATIVTGNADRELAIKHIADSFRNDGQKCSATSLVLATSDVYDDPMFWAQLADAVRSLPVGSAWNPASVITPLIHAPGDALLRGLTVLEPEEEWVLQPERVEGRDDFWTPGIKRGSLRGGFTHMTELFGPVISVMRVRDVDDAVDAVHETGLGLTLGVESLDETEVRRVTERAKVGVIYVRRSTVGAIANRQPFGGFAGSRRGPGIQAGGMNYVTNVMSFHEDGPPAYREVTADELHASGAGDGAHTLLALSSRLLRDAMTSGDGAAAFAVAGIRSQLEQWVDHFSRTHRPAQHVRGEDNAHRYRPLGRVVVRLRAEDGWHTQTVMIGGAVLAGNQVEVSADADTMDALLHAVPEIEALREVRCVREDAEVFARRIVADDAAMVRCTETASEIAVPACTYLCVSPVLMTGRLELLKYLQEQTISDTYHRYGGAMREEDER